MSNNTLRRLIGAGFHPLDVLLVGSHRPAAGVVPAQPFPGEDLSVSTVTAHLERGRRPVSRAGPDRVSAVGSGHVRSRLLLVAKRLWWNPASQKEL